MAVARPRLSSAETLTAHLIVATFDCNDAPASRCQVVVELGLTMPTRPCSDACAACPANWSDGSASCLRAVATYDRIRISSPAVGHSLGVLWRFINPSGGSALWHGAMSCSEWPWRSSLSTEIFQLQAGRWVACVLLVCDQRWWPRGAEPCLLPARARFRSWGSCLPDIIGNVVLLSRELLPDLYSLPLSLSHTFSPFLPPSLSLSPSLPPSLLPFPSLSLSIPHSPHPKSHFVSDSRSWLQAPRASPALQIL